MRILFHQPSRCSSLLRGLYESINRGVECRHHPQNCLRRFTESCCIILVATSLQNIDINNTRYYNVRTSSTTVTILYVYFCLFAHLTSRPQNVTGESRTHLPSSAKLLFTYRCVVSTTVLAEIVSCGELSAKITAQPGR